MYFHLLKKIPVHHAIFLSVLSSRANLQVSLKSFWAFKLIFQLQLPLHLGVGDPFWKFIFFYWIWPKNDSSQNSIQNKIRNIHSKNIHSIVSRIFMRIIHSKKWGKLFKKSNISWFSFVLLNQEIWDAIYLGQLCV